MSYTKTFNTIVNTGQLNDLVEKSTVKSAVKALQNVLHNIGYGDQLNWDKYHDDGDYGGSTKAAVAAFLTQNNMEGDGTSVSKSAGKRMVALNTVAASLRIIKKAIDDNKVETTFIKGSKEASSIKAMQIVLNEMGYGEALNWDKYGADGGYGGSSTNAVKAFAAKEGIESNGEQLTTALAEKMLTPYVSGMGDKWEAVSSTVDATLGLSITKKGSRFVVSDGEASLDFKVHKKGYYFTGTQQLKDFLTQHKEILEEYEISDSCVNMMLAVSENEGNMDAINTYDNSFMTFGMFQWTLGQDTNKGELAGLMKRVKDNEPTLFDQYFGKYGLDIAEQFTSKTQGYMTYNGQLIKTPKVKNQFRALPWCFVFRNSGFNPKIKGLEVIHALERLKQFYWRENTSGKYTPSSAKHVFPFKLSEVMTSEYGVALLVDNHVNRPGYVVSCVALAMAEIGENGQSNWDTDKERRLIQAYLNIRTTYGKYPMTDAAHRAERTTKYLTKGIISDEHNSFDPGGLQSRSASVKGIAPAVDFQQVEHPIPDDHFMENFDFDHPKE